MKVKLSKSAIRIGVLESDPLRFIGLRAMLASQLDFELTSVPPDDASALANSDVVLLGGRIDLSLFEVIEHLKSLRPAVRVIITGRASNDEAIFTAIAGGAKGYVNEAASAAEFVEAIRVVNQGLAWVPRRVFTMLIDRCSHLLQRGVRPSQLTDREKQVLEMLVAGRSNKEIADPLGIEERTVKSHVARLLRKVGVENRVMLSVHAITHSLVRAQ
jgi:DNA-binding NarL/FixJ family response regulator